LALGLYPTVCECFGLLLGGGKAFVEFVFGNRELLFKQV
jgi:hypothetical protein